MPQHIGATKRFLIHLVHDRGAKYVIPNWEGSKEAAIQAILDDPREVFCDCDCEKDERGACTGKRAGAIRA